MGECLSYKQMVVSSSLAEGTLKTLKIFVIIYITNERTKGFKGGFTMKKVKAILYMVTYKDDFNKKHITFVRGYSEVRFLEERFGNVHFEKL